ncbi:MAG: putative mitogen-activated protein kinase phosphatase [Streblomastix strix]|uniref:protein-tyrosine-phosphatase n=1 Tax=Streblomastix strix TaxID=222440 RepID=A0A5J4XBN0_9EUKA|nr:MAG: putative mitogen-activated protein kinase phosphatase [Streblomastix strix]
MIRLHCRDFANMICQSPFIVKIIDIRTKKEFDESHVISSCEIDIIDILQTFQPQSSQKLCDIVFQNQELKSSVKDIFKQLLIVGVKEILGKFPFEIEQIFYPISEQGRLYILEDNYSEFRIHYSYVTCDKVLRSNFKQILLNVPNEIIPSLFLGGWKGTYIFQLLDEMKIDLVINCSVETNYGLRSGQDRQFIQLQMHDIATQQAPLDKGVELIDKALNEGKRVFVHCQMGISRSATIVAAYLIWKYKLSAINALTVIQTQRHCIRPNDGFLKQLCKWELKVMEDSKQIQKDDETDVVARFTHIPMNNREASMNSLVEPIQKAMSLVKLEMEEETKQKKTLMK